MDGMEFIEKSRNLVMDNYNKMLMEQRMHALSPFAPSPDNLKFEDTYCVWMCKTLQNAKGLFASSREGDGLYFEVTYNGDKKEFYVDRYKKQDNEKVADNE